MRYPGFVGPCYTSQSRIADSERLVNLYPEAIESPNGKAQFVLYPTPGFDPLVTLPDAPVRGHFSQNGLVLVAAGTHLYQLNHDWTYVERGSGILNVDGSPVTFASNGDAGGQVFLTSCGHRYLYTIASALLTTITGAGTMGGFIDGFFLSLDADTSTLSISDLEDGTTWDPTQIAQRNDGADRWASMLVAHKEIWLFGTQTTSVYYNAGASPFPFLPNASVFLNHGIAAPFSAAILDNAPIWLGQNTDGAGVVYRANGYTPQRVSTHALEYALSQYDGIADAEAWVYQDQGHPFYVLNFPTAGATWVYDAATGMWHERGAWDGERFISLPVRGHALAYGVHITGDAVSGKVYRMGVDVASDGGGRTLRRLRRAPHLANEGQRVRFSEFQLDMEVGLGLVTGQGSDPQVMLRWSDDGGQTWSNEHWVSAGLMGQYKARAVWNRLGQSRDRVFEVAVTDEIPWRFIDAYLRIRPGVR